jgi:hypothetical protein
MQKNQGFVTFDIQTSCDKTTSKKIKIKDLIMSDAELWRWIKTFILAGRTLHLARII